MGDGLNSCSRVGLLSPASSDEVDPLEGSVHILVGFLFSLID